MLNNKKLLIKGVRMLFKRIARPIGFASLLTLGLVSCYQPPYNNFQPYNRMYKDTATFTAVGAIGGTVAGAPVIGTGIGLGIGLGYSFFKDSRRSLIRALEKEDIQCIQYGDTTTLIVPTDRYFEFNSPRLNNLCYVGLVNIVKLMRCYVHSPIYVAAFTDDVGSRKHKNKLTQARAEAMLTFLWANGIPAQQLHAEGYGDKHPVGQNEIIHGSAYNRRIEIQWFNNSAVQVKPIPLRSATR
jgi:outer membrane protein OmpA-like peptidoglycan-associated protein